MKLINQIIWITALLWSANPAVAGNKAAWLDSFKTANEHYQNNNYQAALKGYQIILNQGYESADLYYNLGNAYYKQNEYALSIWAYEKALLLKPDFEEAKVNLELANRTVTDKVQPMPRIAWWYYWQKIKQLFTVKTWTILSIIGAWLLAAGLFFLLNSRKHALKRTGIYLSFIGFAFAVFCGAIAMNKNHLMHNPHAAIVTTSNVYVKSAPEEESADLFVIHSGLKVSLEDAIGSWQKIKLADGKMGWVSTDDIKPL
ncbi:tetratricopeptide repeat protein [bacterium]|nr:tetratricopeptide repeat protein [bacterium]